MSSLRKYISILTIPLFLFLFTSHCMALESVSGDKITFAWNPSEEADGYILLFAPYPNAEYVGEVDVGNQTRATFNIWEGAAFYVGVQAYNKIGKSEVSNIVTFLASSEESSPPLTLNVTANGENGTVEIAPGVPVSIRVNVELENILGQDRECWVVANTPFGWFSYVSPFNRWIPGIHPFSKLWLSWLNSSEIYNKALSPGEYVIYLAVNSSADGVQDGTWWDAVTVKVRE